jgi:hypothetical protein
VIVIASEAKQSTFALVALWIASSLTLLAMTKQKRPGFPGRFRFSQYLPKKHSP